MQELKILLSDHLKERFPIRLRHINAQKRQESEPPLPLLQIWVVVQVA